MFIFFFKQGFSVLLFIDISLSLSKHKTVDSIVEFNTDIIKYLESRYKETLITLDLP